MRTRIEQVLRVVEHEQQRARFEMAYERLGEAHARLACNAEDVCDRVRHQRGIGERRELDEPCAVWIRLEHIGRHLQCEPRLPAAAGACQRQQVRRVEMRDHLCDLILSTDEARRVPRQVVRNRFERAQRRKRTAKIGMSHLPDIDRRRNTAQPVSRWGAGSKDLVAAMRKG